VSGSGISWACTSFQTDNHTSTPPQFFTGRMPFLPPNQQHQSTEGYNNLIYIKNENSKWLYLDLWSSDWLREAKERKSQVNEAVLEHLQLGVTLNQLETNTQHTHSNTLHTGFC